MCNQVVFLPYPNRTVKVMHAAGTPQWSSCVKNGSKSHFGSHLQSTLLVVLEGGSVGLRDVATSRPTLVT